MKCRTCNGKGTVWQTVCGYPSYQITCPNCHGKGEEPTQRCPYCGGDGKDKNWWNWGNTCQECRGTGRY